MAVLTVQNPTYRGVTLNAITPAVGGDSFPNDGDTVVLIHNQSGASITVTFATPGTPNGLTITPATAVVPASGAYVAGPFPPEWFNDANGRVSMTYSATTSLTLYLMGI